MSLAARSTNSRDNRRQNEVTDGQTNDQSDPMNMFQGFSPYA